MCQILKQRISAGLKAPCEAGRYSGRTPIIQGKFRMTGRLWFDLSCADEAAQKEEFSCSLFPVYY
ncbi:MAG: hypothetical protein LBK53_02330 [Heliobacteriaceae bacterium]|nr:hypothetical protein [Heliobacteriaceae bacterium]